MWTLDALVAETRRRSSQFALVEDPPAAEIDAASEAAIALYANQAQTALATDIALLTQGMTSDRNMGWFLREMSLTAEIAGYVFAPPDCAFPVGWFDAGGFQGAPLSRGDAGGRDLLLGASDFLALGTGAIRVNGLAAGESRVMRYNSNLRDMLLRGPVASATSTTLVSGTPSHGFALSEFENYYAFLEIEIISGTGVGQRRRVSASSGATFTVASAWATTPDATSFWSFRSALPAIADELLVLETMERMPWAPETGRFEEARARLRALLTAQAHNAASYR